MKNHTISDKELVKQYLQGNEACLEMLIKRHKTKIFTTILYIVNDHYIAEDIFQETLIKAIRTLRKGKYNEEGKFLPWIVRIGRNMAIDHFRRAKRTPKITSHDGEDIFRTFEVNELNREQVFVQDHKNDVVRELINTLPKEQKEVLVLRHYGNLSFKEIASITDVSINTALGRMRYALNNMRKVIEEKSISLQ